MNNNRSYFASPTGASVGTQQYYAEAMAAGYYLVEDSGESFKS